MALVPLVAIEEGYGSAHQQLAPAGVVDHLAQLLLEKLRALGRAGCLR